MKHYLQNSLLAEGPYTFERLNAENRSRAARYALPEPTLRDRLQLLWQYLRGVRHQPPSYQPPAQRKQEVALAPSRRLALPAPRSQAPRQARTIGEAIQSRCNQLFR